MAGFQAGNAVQDSDGAVDPVAGVLEVGAGAEVASQEVMMNMVVRAASSLAAMTGRDLLEVDLLEVDLFEVEAALMIGWGVEDLVVHSLLAEEEIGNTNYSGII